MHEEINPSNLYTIDNTTTNNRQREDGDSTSNEENEVDEEEDNNIQWEEQSTTTKLINISSTTPLAHDNVTIGVTEIHPRYYVDLHTNFTSMNKETTIDTINVTMNIDEDAPSLEVGNNNFMSIIQQGLANGNLFALFHLPTKKTQRKEPIVDYSQSHAMILEEYLSKLRHKTLEKEAT
jgi:uncharacterized protein with NAD-binding domain and iron-sulfur cluster